MTSDCDRKQQSKRNVLTEEQVQEFQATLEISPCKSSRRLAQETGVSLIPMLTAIRLIKFHPYKMAILPEF
jgi:hypothetical protein